MRLYINPCARAIHLASVSLRPTGVLSRHSETSNRRLNLPRLMRIIRASLSASRTGQNPVPRSYITVRAKVTLARALCTQDIVSGKRMNPLRSKPRGKESQCLTQLQRGRSGLRQAHSDSARPSFLEAPLRTVRIHDANAEARDSRQRSGLLFRSCRAGGIAQVHKVVVASRLQCIRVSATSPGQRCCSRGT